jgi:hypothetical protein
VFESTESNIYCEKYSMQERVMPNDKPMENAKSAWQSQRVENIPMEFLRLRALDHAQYGRNRAALEYLGAGTGVLACIWLAVTVDSVLLWAGLLALMAGGFYWLHEWRKARLTCSATLEQATQDALQFYRQELKHLRDMHRGFRKAHVIASLPGSLILSAWVVSEVPVFGTDRWWHGIFVLFAAAVWIGSMVWHEADKANQYQRELQELEDKAE